MNNETLQKAMAIHQELEILTDVRDNIKPTYNAGLDETYQYRLSYITNTSGYGCSEWEAVDVDKMKFIGNILNRHDRQIRQEIDNRINELNKELEQL